MFEFSTAINLNYNVDKLTMNITIFAKLSFEGLCILFKKLPTSTLYPSPQYKCWVIAYIERFDLAFALTRFETTWCKHEIDSKLNPMILVMAFVIITEFNT